MGADYGPASGQPAGADGEMALAEKLLRVRTREGRTAPAEAERGAAGL